ncbi:MAG: bifunctional protein-serine/threonine kinase/phosphatase [Gammaproteobacteria bacterium]
MPLVLDAGFSSLQGKRKSNEDSCLVITPSTGQYLEYGALLAVADGVGGLPGGLEASARAIEALRDSYYASPETWGLERTLKDCFDAANQAVLDEEPAGRATTLAALVLRQRRWAVAHAGDTRIWLYRDSDLQQLTRDHARVYAGIGPVIMRACGLDALLNTDIASGEISEGDLFLITSDGVHEVLDIPMFISWLEQGSAQEIAELLTQRALEGGSNDNASACVVRVLQLPAENMADYGADIGALPIGPLPVKGDRVDNYLIGERLHAGRMSSLFKVLDEESREIVVLKFPNPRHADDAVFVGYFLREEWIGRRIDSPYIAKILPPRPGRRTALYSSMAFYKGETLAARIKKKKGLSVQESLAFAQQILMGLDHLHRKGVIHRDVKPENMLIDEDNHLRIIDLGVSRIERMNRQEASAAPIGTPSYMAPEIISGMEADECADVYSAAVALYEMLTGKYPYGEIEPFTHPSYNHFIPPERYNPDVPPWLSGILRKACAPDPHQRYPHAADFAAALASPSQHTPPQRKAPLLERIHPEYWKALFIVSLFLNFLLLFVVLK